MPSKSKAQFNKMGELFSQGKISKQSLDNFNKGVHPNTLPARITPKKPKKFTSIDQLRDHFKKRFPGG